ncbi:MAG: hypothetical protein OXO48_03635 [Caldilineaceae bacterium]|nr:hypothetical protein [Caldilineaceae bacterium]
MILPDKDVEWLEHHFSGLSYKSEEQQIEGELSFCAAYEKDSGKLEMSIGSQTNNLPTHICDAFKVEIHLNPALVARNGWPLVFEVGGRKEEISRRKDLALIDLHFYPKNQQCCLGIKFTSENNHTICRFLYGLVIPFFYRLSYVDKFGLEAARRDLWGEYPHGEEGISDYLKEIYGYSIGDYSETSGCPCGSENTYRDCCLGDVEFFRNVVKSRGSIRDLGPEHYSSSLMKKGG